MCIRDRVSVLAHPPKSTFSDLKLNSSSAVSSGLSSNIWEYSSCGSSTTRQGFFLALVPILTLLLRGQPSTRPLAVAYILLYLFLLSITIWRDGAYMVRAVGLTVVYLGLTLLDLRVSGLSPIVGFYMVAFTAFAAVLLLASQNDHLVNSRCSLAIADAWHCALALHPDAGHDLPLDAPQWVIEQVRHWLAQQAPSQRPTPKEK